MAKQGWRRFRVAALAAILAISAAVAGTKVVQTSGGKDAGMAPARKILVVAVSPDPKLRAGFEEVIAGEISLRGTPAVASYQLFPDLPKEREAFEAKVAAEGFDAVTVSRFVGQSDKVKEKEATGIYKPEFEGIDAWGCYWYSYQQAFLPGYLERETRIRVRTDLWRAGSEQKKPAWSGTSEMLDPRTLAQAAREVAVSIVKALAKAKVI